MARKEDFHIYFNYTTYKIDEGIITRSTLYKIWVNEDETLTIISTDETEGYGTLDKENSQILINVFSNLKK